ncbi:hypothetical protein NMY22_g11734 [Coprinellus aureogranulatus]|nr:hypothetical protein NMY22_g11734 [Coprinellus aureogranulatus]
MFSSKSRTNATLLYAPTSSPPSMTLARQSAYRRREIPPGPDIDLNGWKEVATSSIRGMFSDSKQIKVESRLFLALPLSYTRGATVPCYLSIACDDDSALDIMADPATPCVRLRRMIRFLQSQDSKEQILYSTKGGLPDIGYPPDSQQVSSALSKFTVSKNLEQPTGQIPHDGADCRAHIIEPYIPFTEQEDIEGSLWRSGTGECTEHDIADAIWCTPPGYTPDRGTRMLYGEIHLPKGLQPTCKFPLFSIFYRVELLAPATSVFVPEPNSSSSKGKTRASEYQQPRGSRRDDEHVYASQFVQINTDIRQDEPVPVAFLGRPQGGATTRASMGDNSDSGTTSRIRNSEATLASIIQQHGVPVLSG